MQKWDAPNKTAKKGKKFTARPPLLPRQYNFSVQFYKGAWKGTGVENEILLNLWTGTSWTWVKYKISGRKLPDNWKALSPTVVVKGDKPRLHIPLEKENFNYPKKLEVQAKNKDFEIVAVDLNMGDKLAVLTLLNSDGKPLATKFIRGGKYLEHRRKRLLGKIAKNYSKTGIISSGQSRHKWDKIKQIQDYEAHRISRRIVDWAISQGANVIVFEHLGNLKPQKGKYSHRQNQKRAYWLKSKIFDYTKYKAFANGIATAKAVAIYIGETKLSVHQRWTGTHDCKDYTMRYLEQNGRYELKTAVCAAFWVHVPSEKNILRQWERELIYKWCPPFNKEMWERFGQPFGKQP